MSKSFKDKMHEKAKAPEAMRFITPPPQLDREAQADISASPSTGTQSKAAPPARRALPQYEETKSRRLQLLLTPSLYEAVKQRAAEEHMSVNELVNTILSDTIRK